MGAVDLTLEGDMSNRRFVLLVTFSAILVVLTTLTACGGGEAPTVPPATPGSVIQPDSSATAVSSPTPAPVVEAAAVAVPPSLAATVPPSPTPPPPDTPTPTETPVPAPTATQTPTQVPTATPLPPPFDGTYILIVSQPSGASYSGKTVTFKIDGREAAESVMWEQGGVDELNLTASSAAQRGGTRDPARAFAVRKGLAGRGGPLSAPLLQAPPLAPHVFVGTAAIDGTPVPQGSIVSAWVDGVQVSGAEATVEASPAVSASSAGPVGQALAGLGDNLVRVWKFDAATQEWTFYDPRALFGSFNSIKELSSGQFYYVVTKNEQTADLNGQQRTLYTGWTPLVW